jgi:hypothetical protein
MSRGQSRKGISSTRGRSSSNGVTLSAGGECKAGESTKLEIRTDGVKQAEREVAVGLTQLRKSDSNNGSGTAVIGQLVRHDTNLTVRFSRIGPISAARATRKTK